MHSKQTIAKIAKLQANISSLGFNERVDYCKPEGWILVSTHPDVHLAISLGSSFKEAEEALGPDNPNILHYLTDFSATIKKEADRIQKNRVLLEKNQLASVQAGFESTFWVHTDAETILKFAEKSICGRLNFEYEIRHLKENTKSDAANAALAKVVDILQQEFDNEIEEKINDTTIVYSIRPEKNTTWIYLTREEALALVGKQSFMIQDRTNDVCGKVANVFTMKETKEQVTGPDYIDLDPFVGRRVTTSFSLKEIK